MLRSRSMASLARKTKRRVIRVELPRYSRSGRMATEASRHDLRIDRIAKRRLKAVWSCSRVACGNPKGHQARVVGEPALKIIIIALQHISLCNFTNPKSPVDWCRN